MQEWMELSTPFMFLNRKKRAVKEKRMAGEKDRDKEGVGVGESEGETEW